MPGGACPPAVGEMEPLLRLAWRRRVRVKGQGLGLMPSGCIPVAQHCPCSESAALTASVAGCRLPALGPVPEQSTTTGGGGFAGGGGIGGGAGTVTAPAATRELHLGDSQGVGWVTCRCVTEKGSGAGTAALALKTWLCAGWPGAVPLELTTCTGTLGAGEHAAARGEHKPVRGEHAAARGEHTVATAAWWEHPTARGETKIVPGRIGGPQPHSALFALVSPTRP